MKRKTKKNIKKYQRKSKKRGGKSRRKRGGGVVASKDKTRTGPRLRGLSRPPRKDAAPPLPTIRERQIKQLKSQQAELKKSQALTEDYLTKLDMMEAAPPAQGIVLPGLQEEQDNERGKFEDHLDLLDQQDDQLTSAIAFMERRR